MNILKKSDKQFNLMILPGFLMITLFRYIPMFGLIIAFKNYSVGKGIIKSPWVGLQNFINFFNDPYCFRIIKNSFLLGIYMLIFSFPAPIILALLFNEVGSRSYKKISQTISYLPHFISVIIIVGILKTMFSTSGIVNQVLNYFGLSTINFFSAPEWFRPLYIFSEIWQNVGFNAIIYLAAISGIDQTIYEAAIIDGANRFQIMHRITIPSIMPTVKILFILAISGILGNNFEKIYLMYSPLTYDTADVISTYVYRRGIEMADFGYGTAVGLFQSVFAFSLLYVSNYISRKVSDTSLW